MGKLLLVDGEVSVRKELAAVLYAEHHEIRETAGVEQARRSLSDDFFDAVFTNQVLPDGGGLALVELAQQLELTISFVLLTVPATVQFASESMRRGVSEFLVRPFQPELARACARRACERTQLLREIKRLNETITRLAGNHGEESRKPVGDSACPSSFDLTELLEQTERDLIVQTLMAAGGTQAEAARRMGLSRSALAYKLNKYGIRATNYSEV